MGGLYDCTSLFCAFYGEGEHERGDFVGGRCGDGDVDAGFGARDGEVVEDVVGVADPGDFKAAGVGEGLGDG